MSRNKKPVIAVAVLLVALTLLPLVFWAFISLGTSSKMIPPSNPGAGSGGATSEVVDYDLSQLEKKAEKLLAEDIAEALRKGDVSLDFVAGLNKEAEKARSDMHSGKLRRARERFLSVVTAAENQLAAIAAADKARALKDSTYAELQRLDYLRAPFENTYRDAVENYNKGLQSLEAGEFLQSVDQFELAGAILGEMEARAIQQVAGLLEAGQDALQAYELKSAREAFRAVLEIDSANAAATEGLTMVASLEGIADAVKTVRELESAGKLEEALAALEQLAAKHPNNPFIKIQRNSLEKRILERDFKQLIEKSLAAEKAGDLPLAIAELEAALKLKPDSAQQARLAELQKQYKAARLEILLADGFQALKDGRYEAARNIYKEAIALDPNSKEARTGLEKSSSLYLANIRYTQNVASAERYIKEGRFPVAAKLFNEAMSSRPAKLTPAQQKKEEDIRSILEKQSEEVSVVIESDGRTYVSIIGVLPPDRFKETDLKLFPDVYKVRGTRKGYKDVELELKVDATRANQAIQIECTERI